MQRKFFSLKGALNFDEILRCGRRVTGSYVTVYVKNNEQKLIKLGIMVSKKVGKAVLRNKIKRWIREVVRSLTGHLPAGIDILVVTKHHKAAYMNWPEIKQELVELFIKLGYLTNE